MHLLRIISQLVLFSILTSAVSAFDLLDDRNVTITSAADIAAKRQAQINYIWGPSGFPSDKMPQVLVRGDVSPVGDLPNLERVDTLTYVMDHGLRSYAHHFIPVFKNNRLVVVHLGHDPSFDLCSTHHAR